MITEAFSGGVYHWLQTVVPRLAEAGFDVDIGYWRRDDTPDGDRLATDFSGFLLTDIGASGFGRGPRELIRGITWLTGRTRPDLLHLHSSWAGLAGRLIRGGSARSIFYSPHGYAFLRRDISPATRLAVLTAEAVLGRVSRARTLACGPGEARLARRLGAGARVSECFNGVSADLPAVLGTRTATARAGDERAPLILSSGRLVPQKDPLWVLEAVGEALRADDRAHFTWVGSGPLEPAAREAASRLEPRIRGRVTLVPWLPRDDYLELLTRTTIYLHGARWEGLSLAILEAMALGVPVVVRRNPGCHEVTEKHGGGVVAGDPRTASRSIVRLLADPNLRADLGRAGRRAVDKVYNLDRLSEDLVRAYTADGTGRGRPGPG